MSRCCPPGQACLQTEKYLLIIYSTVLVSLLLAYNDIHEYCHHMYTCTISTCNDNVHLFKTGAARFQMGISLAYRITL